MSDDDYGYKQQIDAMWDILGIAPVRYGFGWIIKDKSGTYTLEQAIEYVSRTVVDLKLENNRLRLELDSTDNLTSSRGGLGNFMGICERFCPDKGDVVFDDLTNQNSTVLEVVDNGVILDNDYLGGARHMWEISARRK